MPRLWPTADGYFLGDLDPGSEIAEALPFGLGEINEICNRTAGRLDAGRNQFVSHLVGLKRCLQLSIHTLNDWLRILRGA